MWLSARNEYYCFLFLQACRGTKLDDGATVADSKGQAAEEMEVDVEYRRIPTEADFLMAYSVVPGWIIFLSVCDRAIVTEDGNIKDSSCSWYCSAGDSLKYCSVTT